MIFEILQRNAISQLFHRGYGFINYNNLAIFVINNWSPLLERSGSDSSNTIYQRLTRALESEDATNTGQLIPCIITIVCDYLGGTADPNDFEIQFRD